MNHRERFLRLFAGDPIDRIPCYFFGAWPETKKLWAEGGAPVVADDDNAGPTLPGMDPDWEAGMWDCHGMVNLHPIGDGTEEILEEGPGYRRVRDPLGAVHLHRTDGASISHTERHALEPDRTSWERLKRLWDPDDPRRISDDYREKAERLAGSERIRVFVGASLYGWVRTWLGVVNLSYLMIDDPALYEEIVSHICDVCMTVMEPVLEASTFEMVYFFEDCCGSNGPLFSPEIADRILKPYYRKLVRFYKDHGVPLVLIDSDGVPDELVPIWLDSGIDIVFPVEVGKWGGSVRALREKYGAGLKACGGVDKYLISDGREAVGRHLESLAPDVEAGGYLPIPDHRIPPSVSYEQMLVYIEEFHRVFG